MKNPKRPKDSNSRAVFIAQLATGEIVEPDMNKGKNPKSVAAGRKGGKARAKKLSAKKRKSIAKKAINKRWSST